MIYFRWALIVQLFSNIALRCLSPAEPAAGSEPEQGGGTNRDQKKSLTLLIVGYIQMSSRDTLFWYGAWLIMTTFLLRRGLLQPERMLTRSQMFYSLALVSTAMVVITEQMD